MAHFMDSLPFDFGQPGAQKLRDLLASNLDQPDRVRMLLEEANIDTRDLDLRQNPRQMWHALLKHTRAHEQHYKLVDAARSNVPGLSEELDKLLEGSRALRPAEEDPLRAAEWVPRDDESDSLERLLSQRSTLLGIAFLHKALQVATGVFRLTAQHGYRRETGTGFRIADDLFLTNHHVIYRNNTPPDSLYLDLGYEIDLDGMEAPGQRVLIKSVDVVAAERSSSPPRDWAVIRWPEPPSPDNVAILKLGSRSVPKVDDRAYIIQHPSGEHKQIGLNRNLIRYVDDDIVQYLTDTEHGSSGSPVCAEDWGVIALHYCWVQAPEKARFQHRNQGIRIDPIVTTLRSKGLI